MKDENSGKNDIFSGLLGQIKNVENTELSADDIKQLFIKYARHQRNELEVKEKYTKLTN